MRIEIEWIGNFLYTKKSGFIIGIINQVHKCEDDFYMAKGINDTYPLYPLRRFEAICHVEQQLNTYTNYIDVEWKEPPKYTKTGMLNHSDRRKLLLVSGEKVLGYIFQDGGYHAKFGKYYLDETETIEESKVKLEEKLGIEIVQ